MIRIKHVLYIASYWEEQVARQRDNDNYSEAARTKILGIIKALQYNDDTEITVLAPGIVRNTSRKFHKIIKTLIDSTKTRLIYASALDLPMLRYLYSLFSVANNIRKIHRVHKIDAIIFYNYQLETAVPALYAKFCLQIPIVLDYEDGYYLRHDKPSFFLWLSTTVEIICKGFIDGAILVNSNLVSRIKIANYVICRGFLAQDIIQASIAGKNSNHKQQLKVMYCGSFDAIRGIDVFISALTYLNGNIAAIITGKGPLDGWVEAECRNIDHIEITKYGWMHKNDLIKLMITSDILVSCQKSNHAFSQSSFPSKLFEFVSTGNVVISSNIPDISCIAPGFIKIYKDDTPECLADALADVVENYDIYRDYGISARNWLVKNNSYGVVGEDIRRVIKNAMTNTE